MSQNDYKSCPLKKRPIVYVAATKLATEILANEQPQDLSLKRKAPADFDDYSRPAKCDYALNLSKSSTNTTTLIKAEAELPNTTYKFRPESPVSISSEFSANSTVLSPKIEPDAYPLENIHMRGLHPTTAGYTTLNNNAHPYQSAFMLAAGCSPINAALWHSYQPSNLNAIFPSPASSINSNSAASPRYGYNYQQITPPSSPGSEDNSEPEDLSVRNDIPLPALFYFFDTAPTTAPGASYNGPSLYHTPSKPAQSQHSYNASTEVSSSQAAQKNYRFKCQNCNKMYSTSIGLSKHQQFHCPQSTEFHKQKKHHACKDCGKLYTTVGALKMHIRTHTLPCKCPICGKAFSRPWLLQGHIRTHTGEKPFRCSDCPRSFADRSNLRAHQQTHVDIKKYACKVCHKSFSRMSLLNKHANSNCTITIA